MHPVSNEVQVPTEGLERELVAIAKRRFTGRARLTLRVKPEAGLAVEIMPTEITETQRTGERQPACSPADVFEERGQPSERELLIRQILAQNAYRFKLAMKLTTVICDFKEGRLNSTQWITVG